MSCNRNSIGPKGGFIGALLPFPASVSKFLFLSVLPCLYAMSAILFSRDLVFSNNLISRDLVFSFKDLVFSAKYLVYSSSLPSRELVLSSKDLVASAWNLAAAS